MRIWQCGDEKKGRKMSTVQQNAGVTVYCPECEATMHLPSRDLLGCKARCWNCQKKVILTEPAAEEPLEFELENAAEDHVSKSDHEEVPEDLWSDEERDLSQ